jgi:hypothetical protein
LIAGVVSRRTAHGAGFRDVKRTEEEGMSKIFYPTAERLKYLLESIDNHEVALPDFQRDFVWDPRETEELIESLCQNYPAGSLLRIKWHMPRGETIIALSSRSGR